MRIKLDHIHDELIQMCNKAAAAGAKPLVDALWEAASSVRKARNFASTIIETANQIDSIDSEE